MDTVNHDIKNSFRNQSGGHGRGNWSSGVQTSKTYDLVGLVRDTEVAKRLKLILRNGCRYSFSYALLPIIQFVPTGFLRIRFGDIEVDIKGRGLNTLEELLGDEVVTWVKEHPAGIDDGEQDIFIKSIEIME